MSTSIKHRRFTVIMVLLVFIMTSILPGMAKADLVVGKASGTSASSSLTGGINGDFDDIKNHPAEAAIRDLKVIGLVSGFPDGHFCPDTPVTQMEAIALAMRLADNTAEISSPFSHELTNVPAWGKTAAQKALQRGIISNHNFQADAPATRIQIIVWLAEAVGIEKEEAGSLPFQDGPLINPKEAGFIQAFYNKGIIKGTPQGNFEPNGVMTRAQLAAILKTILDKNLAGISGEDDDTALVSLDILTVNDFHGALLEDDKNPGAAKLGKWLKDKKATNPDGTLILSAGDMSQGSIDSNLLYGKTVIKAMNEIGFDAMAVGNHEFDWGLGCLKDQSAWADFPILTANITDQKASHPPEGTKPWIMVERKGVKIGIIGVTTLEITDKVNPKVISACKIEAPVETINRLIPELKQQGAQVIIVLGHLGGYLDHDKNTITGEITELAQAVTGADIFVTGHTHQKMAGYINGAAVVQAYYNGRAVGHINLKYSPQHKAVVSVVPSVIDLPASGLTEDVQVKAIIDEGQKEIGPVKNEMIGESLGELAHQRDKVSVLGQWVTDIMRQETNADIAFQNGGGLRTSIPAGEVTIGNLWEVIPFDNTLILLDMKGSQILKVLQHGINNPKYQSLQYSGIKVKYDSLLSPDKRIVEVTLSDGSVLNQEKTYRVVTNDFMSEGGDGYAMFKEGSAGIDTHRLVRELLIERVKKMKTIDFNGDDRFQDNRIGNKLETNTRLSLQKQAASAFAA